jgi:hypothetical protein
MRDPWVVGLVVPGRSGQPGKKLFVPIIKASPVDAMRPQDAHCTGVGYNLVQAVSGVVPGLHVLVDLVFLDFCIPCSLHVLVRAVGLLEVQLETPEQSEAPVSVKVVAARVS